MSALDESQKTETSSRAEIAERTRFRRYAPLVFWMAFIFFASSQEFSAANTSSILRPVLLWLFPRISEAKIAFIHFSIRKCAHFTEYAVLALLSARAFLGSSKQILRRRWFLAALALVAVYALSDEFHQSFVPSRTASVYDSMIDTAGGFSALVLCALWRKIKNEGETMRYESDSRVQI